MSGREEMTIYINGCTFNGNSSVIRYYNNFEQMNTALEEIEQAQQSVTNERLLVALEELKDAVEQNNKTSIKKVVTDFAVQFSSNLFANIAGAALKSLVSGFLF